MQVYRQSLFMMKNFRETSAFKSFRTLICDKLYHELVVSGHDVDSKEFREEFERLMDLFFNKEDDAFISYLARKYTDTGLAKATTAASRSYDLEKRVAAMTPADLDAVKEYVGGNLSEFMLTPDLREVQNFGEFVEGKIVVDLRFNVLASLVRAMGYEQASRVFDVRVITLPSAELNGFAIASPTGRPVIVLNIFLMWLLPMVFTTIYAASGIAESRGELLNWRHEKSDHFLSLVWFAHVAMTGDYNYLQYVTTFEGFPDIVGWSAVSAMAVSEFVLLHEYCHVGWRDLVDTKDPTEIFLGVKLDNPELPINVQREFRADMFAAHAFSEYPTLMTEDLSGTERHAAILLFFQFVALCEYVSTRLLRRETDTRSHPPACSRIKMVQDYIVAKRGDAHFSNSLIRPFLGAFAAVDLFAEMSPVKLGTLREALRQITPELELNEHALQGASGPGKFQVSSL